MPTLHFKGKAFIQNHHLATTAPMMNATLIFASCFTKFTGYKNTA
jgi:hypothetical protein